MKFISLLFILGTILIYPTLSYSQTACYPKQKIAPYLKKEFNEFHFWTGVDAISKTELNMYVNPRRGTFTITLTPPQDLTVECVLVGGKDFSLPKQVKKEKKGVDS